MIMKNMINKRLIETDKFPVEFICLLAERESWRKELHRPIYYIHKWWAKRLGSVFRGILLGCFLPEESNLPDEFYKKHSFKDLTVLDPLMGSGVTIGEAHKIGAIAIGQDINPVAVNSVKVSLGRLQKSKLEKAYKELSSDVGEKIKSLYKSKDSLGRPCDALYYFWAMQAPCPECRQDVDLFSSYIISSNAYPKRKADVRILCPTCGNIFLGLHGSNSATCIKCKHQFDPTKGPAKRAKAVCSYCGKEFQIIDAVGGKRPKFRLYGKLILTSDNKKEYLPINEYDIDAYHKCSSLLYEELESGNIRLPELKLEDGYNTRQAISYGFCSWRDFFNDRQLLALGWLHEAIASLHDEEVRNTLLILFSGILEFNNMFASYKGEGTGAVRHMFAHHILKPERTSIEANVWGTAKSSGSFSTLFRNRLLRAVEYQSNPTEVNSKAGKSVVCSPPFSGKIKAQAKTFLPHTIYLSCGDSSNLNLPNQCIDVVVTDPPFFDNVHYSELADFFYAWQQLTNNEREQTTRSPGEVQDTKAEKFTEKLERVFKECHRVLKDEGLLVFTYHHSRAEGWTSVFNALHEANFSIVNSHPVKSEMSVATPKSQAKEPINFDIVIVCRKKSGLLESTTVDEALQSAKDKIVRLQKAGFRLSKNDLKIIVYSQIMLPSSPEEIDEMFSLADNTWKRVDGDLDNFIATFTGLWEAKIPTVTAQ